VLKDELASMTTVIADLKAAQAKVTEGGTRRTLPPEVSAMLSKAGLMASLGDTEEGIGAGDIDKAMKDTNLSIAQRLEIKAALRRDGRLK
jgi:hypothetical protein